jgi:predicted RND superfamily exporter protein
MRVKYLETLCIDIVARHATACISLFCVSALLLSIVAVRGFSMDTSVEGLMLVGDPERTRSAALKTEYSNDEVIVAAFDLGRVFEADDLRAVHRVTETLEAVEGVAEVLSLTNIEDVRGTDATLDSSSLIDLEELNAAQIARLQARVHGHLLYERNLVSPTLDVLAIVVVLEPPSGSKETIRRSTRDVRAALDAADLPWPWHLAGFPVNEFEADRLVRRDLLMLAPVSMLGVLWVVRLSFGSWAAVWLVLSLVSWSSIVAMAWMGASATRVTMITSAVPAILLACSGTYAIYVLGALREVSRERDPATELIRIALSPALLSAASTGIGFLSLRTLNVSAINDLGTCLAMGIFAALLGTMFLLPALVSRFDIRLSARTDILPARWRVVGVRWAQQPFKPMAVALVLVLVSIPGIRRIEVVSDPLTYFQKDSPLREDAEFVRKHLAGTGVVNVVLQTETAGDALEPNSLQTMDDVLTEIAALPHVDRTISFLDYIELIDGAMRPGRQARRVLPSRDLAAQYMFLYEAGGDPGDYRHYINFERDGMNAFIRSNSLSSTDVLAISTVAQRHAAAAGDDVSIEVRGSLYLLAKAMDAISRMLASGLVTALWLIGVVMIVALRSVPLALVAAVPNVIPIVVCSGLMGWLGIPLSIGTSVVGCIALGLAVDDTAHVIGHLERGGNLSDVYRVVATPLLVTTLSLSCGFSALLLSEFQPVWVLGAATIVVLLLALACDLLLLPSLLAVIGWPLAEESPYIEEADIPGVDEIPTAATSIVRPTVAPFSPTPRARGNKAPAGRRSPS